MICYKFTNLDYYFAAAVVFKSCISSKNVFIGKTTKIEYRLNGCGTKTILMIFIYIKIIWYAPLLFQFKRIAKCVLFIISWEMAHARIAFGSKIEPKMLPINKQIKNYDLFSMFYFKYRIEKIIITYCFIIFNKYLVLQKF